ncbi:Aminotransferase, s III [Pseudomonas syringae pv. papulans]|nr:Aminotransferase, s III [Pseudomonas syringae pv. papulans]RMN50733.1 Aminotransferase, s III [Pseudomonas syringae pv. papulans]RMN86225.1 Aminotransferase, s III [Pseudomonas syringae pv. papulans]RMV44331.1 Aminotransferase, s III [Pseudomonas syringae pv. papulans]
MYMYPFSQYKADVPKVISGQGVWLFDEQGKGYIDASSGPMTVNLGHCHPTIINAMQRQVERLHFAYRLHFRSDEAEQLAARLVELSDDNKGYAFFLNGGSEASEAAYRIALDHYRYQGKDQKNVALGRRITNHGNTIQSLEYGDDRARKVNLLGSAIDPSISEVKLPPCYCLHCPMGKAPQNCQLECVTESLDIIDRFGADRIACIFIEPITASSGGALVPHERYMRELKAGLVERDILLIADEIVTGLGRTGEWFNMKTWDTEADITIVGKGLGAGFTPISGLLVSRSIGKQLASHNPPHFIGHTYSGNPLSTGIALSVLNTVEHEVGLQTIRHKGRYLRETLVERLSNLPCIADIRGQGLLWAVETTLNRSLAQKFIHCGHEHGINLYACRSSGKDGQALTFLFTPPFIITEGEIDELVDRFRKVFDHAL